MRKNILEVTEYTTNESIHYFSQGRQITRKEAIKIMRDIMK